MATPYRQKKNTQFALLVLLYILFILALFNYGSGLYYYFFYQKRLIAMAVAPRSVLFTVSAKDRLSAFRSIPTHSVRIRESVS
jgi:hypothetical protein